MLYINICLHSSFYYEGIWQKLGSVIDSPARLLDLPQIYIATGNVPLGRSEKLNLCYIYKKKSYILRSGTCITCSLRINLSLGFLVPVFLNSWKISKKLSIMESDFNIFVSAILLKLLCLMDNFLNPIQDGLFRGCSRIGPPS